MKTPIKWLADFWIVAYLKRIAAELHTANELTRERMRLQHPQWARDDARGRTGKRAKLSTVTTPTVEQWNEEWAKKHPEPELEEEEG